MSKEANASQPLIGRESTTVPGRFGEPLTVEHSVTSRGGFDQHATHPLFLCLHGWGSSEEDMADIMRLIAPYNDFVALRGPLTLAPAREGSPDPGNYAWFHDALPIGDDRDYDAYAAATAVDRWVADNIPADRDVVPLGFSQGGLVAVHLLRINPERYRAVVSLSGFNAPGQVPGTAPADSRLADYDIPVFYTYGKNDGVIPKYELFGTVAGLSSCRGFIAGTSDHERHYGNHHAGRGRKARELRYRTRYDSGHVRSRRHQPSPSPLPEAQHLRYASGR